MSTYKNWELGTDFPPWQNILINYIFNKWTETDPPKGAEMESYDQDDPTTVNNVIFRPGFPVDAGAYKVSCRRAYTRKIENLSLTRHWLFEIGLIVNIKCRRLESPDSDPMPGVPIQIHNMEEEVERIIGEYKINDIPGAFKLDFVENIPVYSPDDSYLKTEWESNTNVIMQATKMSTTNSF